MNTVKLILDSAKNHLEILKGDNIVIGGIHALRLHGIVLHRDAVDLDIVIYQPTQEQEDYLELLIEQGKAEDGDDIDGERYRSYKLEENGNTIDFLLEREKSLPENLLSFTHNSQIFFVQSVENVIEAKRGYFDGFEFRPKDEDDCKALRELNFNLHKNHKPVNFEAMAKKLEQDGFSKDDLPF